MKKISNCENQNKSTEKSRYLHSYIGFQFQLYSSCAVRNELQPLKSGCVDTAVLSWNEKNP